jgi:hypothetical protein
VVERLRDSKHLCSWPALSQQAPRTTSIADEYIKEQEQACSI